MLTFQNYIDKKATPLLMTEKITLPLFLCTNGNKLHKWKQTTTLL